MPDQGMKKWRAAIPGLLAFILLCSILLYSKEAFQAALAGLELWLRVVFPALLPFFIASEIMTGLGVVDFLSVLLQPVMGPLFRCPGSSSFIWAMSATSGYPVGARLVALFRQQKKITVEEGQRILSFCSTSGPLFMMGAVAVGMLNTPEGGKIILVSHYGAAILLGLLFRNYGKKDQHYTQRYTVSLNRALTALTEARKRDGRPLGELMGDAVRNSVNIQLMVGGFIILFSVVIDLLVRVQVIHYTAALFSMVLRPLGLEVSLMEGIIGGVFEVTVGCKMISEAAVSLQLKIAAASFLIGWSGFSIHAQAASILSGSGIRFGRYLVMKLFHGLLAALISYPVTSVFYPKAAEVFQPIPTGFVGWREILTQSVSFMGFAFACLAAGGLAVSLWRMIRQKAARV